jgi:hypothetical protein
MANNASFLLDGGPPIDLSENKGPGLLIVTIAMPTIAFLIVCIRLHVRLFVVHSVGRDDWLILIASVSVKFL